MPARVSLGFFYLSYFGVLGVYLPYFTLYLEQLGFDALQIALVAAILPLGKATAPIVWGMLADRSGRRRELTIVSVALSLVALLLLLGAREFAAVAGVMAVYALVNSGALPLVEATTLETVGGSGYGATRVWGSVGFILFAGVWGVLLDRAEIRWVLYGLAGLSAANFLSTFGVPRAAPHAPDAAAPGGSPPRRGVVALFFASTLLQQASHGPYYAYFSLHLDGLGWSRAAIGCAWMVGVLSEVLMMVCSARLSARWGLGPLLGVTHAAAIARWSLLVWITNPAAILLSQMLHALTFGAFHVASVRRTQELFAPARRALGQSLYSALTYGAGSAVGMLGGGFLHDRLGVRGLFAAGAAAAFLSLAAQVGSDALASRHAASRS